MQYRIGVIGATGYIGTPYRKEIRESSYDARIVGLCARRRDRLEKAAKEDGATIATSDWRELVDHADINLILVLTPDALHLDPVLATIEAGKNVVCEKPLGKNVTEAHSMWAAAKERGVATFVPFWTRYVPAFCRIRQLIQEGVVGEVRGFVYRWHNPRPVGMPFTWRDSAELSASGSIADVGSHAYDTLRFVLGAEAKRVLTHADVIMKFKPDVGEIDLAEALELGERPQQSDSTRHQRGSAPDYAQIAVEFENGIVGSILLSHASSIRKGFAPELEVHGTEASLSVDRFTGELRIADSPEPARVFETIDDDGYCNRFENHVFPAFDQQLSGQPCDHPNLNDGWRVQIFTDAAAMSAQRKTWVSLAEFDDSDLL